MNRIAFIRYLNHNWCGFISHYPYHDLYMNHKIGERTLVPVPLHEYIEPVLCEHICTRLCIPLPPELSAGVERL
jgi:hypothetical protein